MARESGLDMTPVEVRGFLRRKSVLFLATLGEDGVPVGDVARFVFKGDALVFEIPRHGCTYRNLQRDGRIACCAEQNPDYFGIASVIVHGRAWRVTSLEQVALLTAALYSRGAPLPASRAASKPSTVLLRVPLGEDIVSFDFAKIADRSGGADH